MHGRASSLAGVPLPLGALAAILCASSACASTDRMPAAPVAIASATPVAGAVAAPVESPAAAPAANPWLDPAREVLVPRCGSCHRGDLPTALPKALAIFDLTHPIWNENLTPPQYDGILSRVRSAGAVTPEDLAAVEAFVHCARDGVCGAS